MVRIHKRCRNQRVIGTLCTRNEADVLEFSLEHNLNHGIDVFLAMDNGSTDGTFKILLSHPQVIEVYHDDSMTHPQGVWSTKLAQRAYELGAEWVVHTDADEFWIGLEYLSSLSDDITVVKNSCSRYHFPAFYDGKWHPDKFFNFIEKDYPKHVIHRALPNVKLKIGHHHILHEDQIDQGKEVDWLTFDHYPHRSYEQFERKIVEGFSAIENQPPDICAHWREWHKAYQKGKLKEVWDLLGTDSFLI